jgi:hypothetical protein
LASVGFVWFAGTLAGVVANITKGRIVSKKVKMCRFIICHSLPVAFGCKGI